MSLPYWCIVIAAILPYVWVSLAKGAAPDYNNKDPRGWVAKQQNYRVRNANAAHLNAFEAFPAFAAAVLMAQFAQVDAQRVAWLCIGFIIFRILHGVFYLSAKGSLRSLAWLGGFACVVTLMILSALKVAT